MTTKLKNELIFGLKRTGESEVYVDFKQVAEILGEAKASELCIFKGTMQQAMHKKNVNSLIPEEKRILNVGLSGFNREQLLAALEPKPTTTTKVDK